MSSFINDILTKGRILSVWVLSILILFSGCSPDDEITANSKSSELTIFFINDHHGQLDNFSKIKHIIDLSKEETNVLVACSGDMFSGNPVVDNYPEKGYPMVDVMNRVGFDISVLGNHEFDYGPNILKDRMNQADFEWVCANVVMGNSGVPQPAAYTILTIDDLQIAVLGLVETNGKDNGTIPSTHPWRVQDFTFERPENVVADYSNIKQQENADLFIALTHLGHNGYNGVMGDFQLASEFPYFDLIIGGHTNQLLDTVVNGIPVFQSGSYLNYLGQINLTIANKAITSINHELIDLNSYTGLDAELKTIIDQYNDQPQLDEVIGYSHNYHYRSNVGCFYTDALAGQLNVDISFQNSGGVRSNLDEGDITKREIFEIDPFNNGTVIYTMTIAEIKTLLTETGSGFYYSGVDIWQDDRDIVIEDMNGTALSNSTTLTVGINDYIPAVNDLYFPNNGIVQPLTTAETIIAYLENSNGQVDYPSCSRYFKYQY